MEPSGMVSIGEELVLELDTKCLSHVIYAVETLLQILV